MTESKLYELWDSCLRGDRVAQFALYNKFSPGMYALCLRYAKDQNEASEILQSGFIKVFTKGKTFSKKGSLEGWIRKIMVYAAIEHLRSRKASFNLYNGYENTLAVSSNSIYDYTDYKDLTKVIQGLPDGYRTVFNMYVIEGYSHKEIARMLNIQEGSSKYQVYKARAWLQSKLMLSNKKEGNYEQ